jgi:LPS-assembly lipoprotein
MWWSSHAADRAAPARGRGEAVSKRRPAIGGAVARAWKGLALAAALAACGFTPLDAPGGGPDLVGRVAILPIDSLDGFIMTGRLEASLGRAGPLADRQLSVALAIENQAMALTTQNEIDRFNLLGRADWRLAELGTGTVLAAGTVRDFTAYSATGSTIATLSAERDAYRRLVLALADAIVTDMTLTLAAP